MTESVTPSGARGLSGLRLILAQDAAEVAPAGGVLDEEAEAVGDLGAEDGADAGGVGGAAELDGAVEVAPVGEGDGGEAALGGQGRDPRGRERRVEERVPAMGVERDGRAHDGSEGTTKRAPP
jgi:hypothetical protein